MQEPYYQLALEYTVLQGVWAYPQQLRFLRALNLLCGLTNTMYSPDSSIMSSYREILGASCASIKDAVRECTPMIARFRTDPHLELECRFGSIGPDDSFAAGLPFDAFKHILHDKLMHCSAWSDEQEWTLSMDAYWGPVRGVSSTKLLTELTDVSASGVRAGPAQRFLRNSRA